MLLYNISVNVLNNPSHASVRDWMSCRPSLSSQFLIMSTLSQMLYHKSERQYLPLTGSVSALLICLLCSNWIVNALVCVHLLWVLQSLPCFLPNFYVCFENTCFHIFLSFYFWHFVMLPALMKITLVVALDAIFIACLYETVLYQVYIVSVNGHALLGYLQLADCWQTWCLWLTNYIHLITQIYTLRWIYVYKHIAFITHIKYVMLICYIYLVAAVFRGCLSLTFSLTNSFWILIYIFMTSLSIYQCQLGLGPS